MAAPPAIYKPGDNVTINCEDYYQGQTGTIVGLSPATLKRRDNTKQWRYRVNFKNGEWSYYAEKHLTVSRDMEA